MGAPLYRLTVQGHLDGTWSDWFDGLTITLAERGETILTGPVVDQAALHGLLIKIRDLGLPLLAVTRLDLESAAGSNLAADTAHEDRRGRWP